MNKRIYLAYDGTKFDNIQEGYEYDRKVLNSVSNDIWFVDLGTEDKGFNEINLSEVNVEAFWHTNKIEKILDYFVKCPIIYCHTDKAAEVLFGFLNPKWANITDKHMFDGLKKGINFFIHLNNDDMFFWQWGGFEYMYTGKEREKIENIIGTIEEFIDGNLRRNFFEED